MRPKMILATICVISAAAFAACKAVISLSMPRQKSRRRSSLAAPPATKATPEKTQPKKTVAKRDVKTPATSNTSNAVASANVMAASTHTIMGVARDGREQHEDLSIGDHHAEVASCGMTGCFN